MIHLFMQLATSVRWVRRALVVVVALLLLPGLAYADLDWGRFLSRSDFRWQGDLPSSWSSGPFLGNGVTGLMIWQSAPKTLTLACGYGRYQEHRKIPNQAVPMDIVHLRGRLPVGHFTLSFDEAIVSCDWRVSLYTATFEGVVVMASKRRYALRAYVAADTDAISVQVTRADAQSPRPVWQWHPDVAKVQRAAAPSPKVAAMLKSRPNPPGVLKQVPRGSCWYQSLAAGGDFAVMWLDLPPTREAPLIEERIIALGAAFPQKRARSLAGQALRKVARRGSKQAYAAHCAWWAAYYPASFVSLSDGYWERFYWRQMYKLASATRSDGMVIDTLGPWLQPTSWGAVWWNLNVQLSYWPCYTSNRVHLAESFRRALTRNRRQLMANTPPKMRSRAVGIGRCSGQDFASPVGEPGDGGHEANRECGNYLWALHTLWMHWEVTQDRQLLMRELYPQLVRAVNYYRSYLTRDKDGIYHIPTTHSPEYADAPDATYDLSLLKWAVSTLLKIEKMNKRPAAAHRAWVDLEKNLAPYAIDPKEGFLIGRNKRLTSSHRHFSHLLMVYPLKTYLPTTKEHRDVIRKTLNHWHSFKGALQGYSFTGGSIIASQLGDGERSYQLLNGLKDYVTPNTFYAEGGNPVIETPLSAAQSLHEMWMQSSQDEIKIFPAVPQAWHEIHFQDLRAVGARLVSAYRKHGKTQWIRVRNDLDTPQAVTIIHGMGVKPTITGTPAEAVTTQSLRVTLPPKGTITLSRTAKSPDTTPKAARWSEA